MTTIEVEQEDIGSGMFIVSLHVDGKFIKKICECYEEEYAKLIAVKLSEGING